MRSEHKATALAFAALFGLSRPVLARVDRGAVQVEFLYAIESAGGRADKLREPTDIFLDRKTGELYVADAATHKVLIYDKNGMFLQGVGVGGTRGAPRMVAVDGEGRLFVGHMTSPLVSVFDFRGEPLGSLSLPGIVDTPGASTRPMALSVGPGGAVYALKSVGGLVKVDPYGESHEEIAVSGEGSPNVIYGMAVDSRGRFLFTDMRPYSVVIFDPATQAHKRFGSAGVLYGQLDRPIGIAADEAGHIFVVSTVTNKVSCFDSEGTFIEEFGGMGEGYGRFYMPTKIASDGKDQLYVLENTLKRVQVFRVQFPKEKEVTPGSGTSSS